MFLYLYFLSIHCRFNLLSANFNQIILLSHSLELIHAYYMSKNLLFHYFQKLMCAYNLNLKIPYFYSFIINFNQINL
jgi:hypothetical protein